MAGSGSVSEWEADEDEGGGELRMTVLKESKLVRGGGMFGF